MTPGERMREASLQAILELLTDLHRKQLLLTNDETGRAFRDALARRLRALRAELASLVPPSDRICFEAEWARVSQEVQDHLAVEPTHEELNTLGPIWEAAHRCEPPTPD